MRLMLAALVAVIATGVSAQEDSRWVRKVLVGQWCDGWGHCRAHYKYVRVEPTYGRSYSLTYTHPHRHECLHVRAVVGLEKYNIEEARQNAIDMWSEQVKLHHGVKFMNPDNAIVMSDGGRGPDCYVSATGTRASEKAAEAIGRKLSQCELIARPCAGPIDEGRGRR